ncbi:serine/threonine-protein kinase [Pyxidicoccus xibeiensis]|uniref:serine/threonine-protein kinase n=1 Tax=Pyxidicoccus xibeiensis TaxID=2906759 RepID=UPI0020A702C7|nr:serine/threonine-protein kinase [Pyxidicoccus xibeiensis]MCP3138014.1 serine/threonine protein kinase [Pyxidicoccus xibeiensis]
MTLVGRHIGRYRILEQLGSGGMSVVYKGLDTALDREVAVKVLHPHLAGKDESRRRLAREARAVAKLHHPNILEVFDFSSADAQDAFIVTEYIRGQTLKTFLDEGPMDPPELAAMVIHELAAALAHAHEAGVIHRDLKPENVMVREDGVLKLMDFGIARLLDIEERMTVTGTLVGSPAHMAPEIIEGLEAGPEADVFSVGIMFYAAMTGRLPFTATNTTATLKRILDGDYEDPRRRVPTLSDELADICATCLQREPERRYPDAAKLRDALADYLAGLGFARVGEELVSFFADPQSYRKLARQRIVATLLERSERLLAEKRTPRALGCLNHVLALDATNARALALLKGLRRAQRIKKWQRRGLRAGLGLAAVAVLGLGGWKAHQSHATPAPTEGGTAGTTGGATPPPSDGSSANGPAMTRDPSRLPDGSDDGAPEQSRTPPPGTPPALVDRGPDGPRPPASRGALPQTPPGGLTPPQDANPSTGGTPRPTPARAAAPAERAPSEEAALRKPLLRKVPVSILVRPFGIIRVDDGPPSPQPLAQHAMELPPGRHSVTISCDYCEDVVDTIDVSAEGENLFHLRAQPKPALLSFEYEPAGATVRVGEQLRTAQESLQSPFEVRSPRGPAGFQHTVVVDISHPGYQPERRVVHLRPGTPTILRGSLLPE